MAPNPEEMNSYMAECGHNSLLASDILGFEIVCNPAEAVSNLLRNMWHFCNKVDISLRDCLEKAEELYDEDIERALLGPSNSEETETDYNEKEDDEPFH